MKEIKISIDDEAYNFFISKFETPEKIEKFLSDFIGDIYTNPGRYRPVHIRVDSKKKEEPIAEAQPQPKKVGLPVIDLREVGIYPDPLIFLDFLLEDITVEVNNTNTWGAPPTKIEFVPGEPKQGE